MRNGYIYRLFKCGIGANTHSYSYTNTNTHTYANTHTHSNSYTHPHTYTTAAYNGRVCISTSYHGHANTETGEGRDFL